MPYRRRSRRKRFLPALIRGLGVTAAIIIAVIMIAALGRSLFAKEEVVTKEPPKTVPLADIREPEPDASSETGGVYYGLCKKNSIRSVEDFRRTVEEDVTLSAHFAGFNWENAKLGRLEEAIWTFVSYRKGDTVRRTSRPILLPAGDGYITDGSRTVRTYCCNDYVLAPPPTEVSIAEPESPTERVDGPPGRMNKAVERVDGPPLQLSSGAPPEESAGAIPASLEKVSYYSVPIYPGVTHLPPDGPFKVYSSPRHRPVVTPEPGTVYLVGGGAAAITLFRLLRRKRSTAAAD